jgi:hypothetical protein
MSRRSFLERLRLYALVWVALFFTTSSIGTIIIGLHHALASHQPAVIITAVFLLGSALMLNILAIALSWSSREYESGKKFWMIQLSFALVPVLASVLIVREGIAGAVKRKPAVTLSVDRSI